MHFLRRKKPKTAAKFIVRDAAQVGKHTQKQGRETHLERKGINIPLMKRITVKRWVSPLYRAVLLGL